MKFYAQLLEEQMYPVIYIIKQDIRIYICGIADQTAGQIWLKFFEDTHGWSGVFYAKKIRILFLFLFNFF